MRARLCLQISLLIILFAWALPHAAAADRRTENIVLVTLDGVRTQEMFGGLDLEILKSVTKEKDGPVEATPTYKRYWAPAAEERRLKLMPFLWGTLLKEHGSIAGNRARGSTALLANRHRFSYPGYSEILLGEARDDVIDSNDKKQNPFPTVLEYLQGKLGLDERKVAVFASWDVFDWIVERRRGAITANAGIEEYSHPDPVVREISRLQSLTLPPWDGVRHDSFTFRFAMAHLASYQPRVLYVALDETDDWAHDGRYDRVLATIERIDGFLRELWETLERMEPYRGKTTLLITTDHGRGVGPEKWREHGKDVEGAQYVWIAVASPDSAARGEWTDGGTVYSNQIAATLCRLLGFDYGTDHPAAGKPLEQLFR